ncbi:hypothetical protein B0T16DRAFT_422457 [Cercophora newfieldiana]|uniref:chorismate synthase n=1 Tax=Cercophora newfieldiana TaxID=92897 RepID=A0AA39XTH3_9PEZI|nr:hypothetical protein B0T16DRAFT_422457 [Cercophora newfieldiana]
MTAIGVPASLQARFLTQKEQTTRKRRNAVGSAEENAAKDSAEAGASVLSEAVVGDDNWVREPSFEASSGGGQSSARETIARVAAGAIAEKYLRLAYGVRERN